MSVISSWVDNHDAVAEARGALRCMVALSEEMGSDRYDGSIPLHVTEAEPEHADAAVMFGLVAAVNCLAGFGCLSPLDEQQLPESLLAQFLPVLRGIEGTVTALLDRVEDVVRRDPTTPRNEEGWVVYPAGWVGMLDVLCGLQRVAECALVVWDRRASMTAAA